MTEENPFASLSQRVKVIKVAGKEIKIKPKVKDYAAFMIFGKDITETDPEKRLKLEELKAQKLMDKLVEIISRAYPSENKENIEAFVAENFLEVSKEIFVAMGLAKREDLEKIVGENPLAKTP